MVHEASVPATRLRKRFEVRNYLPALGFRETTPGWHAVLLAAIGQQPEELSSSGSFDTLGVQAGTEMFASILPLGIFPVASGAVLDKEVSASSGSICIGSIRIGAATILCRDLPQPCPVPGRGKHRKDQRQNKNRGHEKGSFH